MGLIANWRRRRALHRYSQRLPAELAKNYGASTFYTARQIEAAVGRQKLSSEFLWLGYAAFLSEPDFIAATQDMAAPLAYGRARALMEKYRPAHQPNANWENPNFVADWSDPGSRP